MSSKLVISSVCLGLTGSAGTRWGLVRCSRVGGCAAVGCRKTGLCSSSDGMGKRKEASGDQASWRPQKRHRASAKHWCASVDNDMRVSTPLLGLVHFVGGFYIVFQRHGSIGGLGPPCCVHWIKDVTVCAASVILRTTSSIHPLSCIGTTARTMTSSIAFTH